MRNFIRKYCPQLFITIVLVILCATIGLIIWYFGQSMKESKKNEYSETIKNIVQQYVNQDLILPKIIYIGIDTVANKDLKENIAKEISKSLIIKYLNNDNNSYTSSNIEIKPFFVLPNKPNKNGDYILSETQLNDLKGHLDFLSKQIDRELDARRNEMNNDIDRLNLWVSIWIGVIGFLGIFIPIIINIDTSKSVEESKRKSDTALEKSNEAHQKIEDADLKRLDKAIEDLNSINSSLPDIEKQSNDAKKESGEASSDSKQAIRKADLSILSTNINRINFLEEILQKKQQIPNLNSYISKLFNEIYICLQNVSPHFDDSIVKDNLTYFARKLFTISTQFKNRDITSLLDDFGNAINSTLSSGLTMDNYSLLLADLKNIIDKLDSNNK